MFKFTLNSFLNFYDNIYSSFYSSYRMAIWSELQLPELVAAGLIYMPQSERPGYGFFCDLIYSHSILFCFLAGFGLFYASYGLQLVRSHLNTTDSFSDFFSFLSDCDDEVGSIDDILFYSLLFVCIIIWFFMFTIFSMYSFNSVGWVVAVLNLIFVIAILTPMHVMYSFGLSFPMYIRGAGRTSSFIAETFLDFVAIGVMFARFLIQNVRLLLIFIAFFELFELIYQNCDLSFVASLESLVSFNTSTTSLFLNNYWYDWFGDFLVTTLTLTYYWGHLVYTFIGQLMNYFLLSFYLFYFLYTSFVLEQHEVYFLRERMQDI